ncbi:hypothetical protein [Yoonia sediminilitoris]|uniref:Uncharacterized protein n=1 Tax=Yoonia sediminilitoris TaxID=1286148 RepID=A0A2T6KBZ5_9RHOB|nr:hypothetical protein [Yoonia sediminilitoris]PUB12441.1 hypothetical protein C8N45_11080 [Yoonia sediminilitoris]RCW93135.1 hypothetical protein DFP92_11080 [Yoonia sediminilitoris]
MTDQFINDLLAGRVTGPTRIKDLVIIPLFAIVMALMNRPILSAFLPIAPFVTAIILVAGHLGRMLRLETGGTPDARD